MPEKLNKEFNVDYIPELEGPDELKARAELFSETWSYFEKEVFRVNRLKGLIKPGVERNAGEMIALMHSELSECLEALRHGNKKSQVIDMTHAEEELADVLTRLMDFCFNRGFNLPKAFMLKMQYNKTRPYRHGGKRF